MVPKDLRLLLLCAALSCFDETNAENASQLVGIVRNLTVELIARDEPHRDDKYGFLRFNVSWRPSPEGKRPSSYSIMISNFPREENKTVNQCPDESLYYTSSNSSQLSVLLPQNRSLSEMPEFSVRPNCSYKIEVFANPRTKSTLKNHVIFTVPECSNAACVCEEILKKLPTPEIDAKVEGNRSFVTWNVTSRVFVKSFAISLGVPILTSNSGMLVYNVTKIDSVPANDSVYLWGSGKTQKFGKLENGQKIVIGAVGENDCAGPEGSLLVSLPETDHFVEIKLIWLTLIAIVSGCVLISIFRLSTTFGRKYQFIWSSLSFVRVRTPTPKRGSIWAESILLNRNVLYVEQDTEVRYEDEQDDLEVPYKSVQLLRQLGEGQFGSVFLGRLENSGENLVAVKMSRQSESPVEARRQLIEEINIIKAAGPHENLVRLVGYCTSPRKPLCIIFEYVQGGDLLIYLRSRRREFDNQVAYVNEKIAPREHRPSLSETLYTTISSRFSSTSTSTSATNSPLRYIECYNADEAEKRSIVTYVNTNGKREGVKEFRDKASGPVDRDLFIKFAMDIAKGMRHLEAKGITHRDLAARNVLLASDSTLKISDFGLSRNGIYVMSSSKKGARHLPIRWMSPEALRERAFSSKSDIWSFGIVLWEIATLGAFPYPDIQDDRLLSHLIHNNGHPERPEDVCHDIYEIMLMCWRQNPQDRPTFAHLLLNFKSLKDSLHSFCETSNPCYTILTHIEGMK